MSDSDQQTTERPSTAKAEVRTDKASRYLQQLCKHFAHRCEVAFDAQSGSITLPLGVCSLEAGEGVLRLAVTAGDAAQRDQLEDVIARHLLRFAFREELEVVWD